MPLDAHDAAIDALAELLQQSKTTVMLTGAGASTESGLPDYRGPDGLWRNRRFEELASISMFRAEPIEFWDFYRERLAGLRAAQPNAGHHAVARLEHAGLITTLVTQNVDALHRAAGSHPLEVHGSLDHAVCLSCSSRFDMDAVEAAAAADADGVPRCSCGDALKPDVVLFGEMLPPAMEQAVSATTGADVFIVCGSSLQVYPVAGLAELATSSGAELAVINLGDSGADHMATVRIDGAFGEVLPLVAAAASC